MPFLAPGGDADPIRRLAAWSAETLKVPAGHADAGKPLVLPEFATSFLADALSHRESLLCMGRKNAKSAIVAVLALGFLVGPLRTPGWRGAVASVSKEKANELRLQAEQIANASGLTGLRFVRSPQPGRIESQTGALDVLSADRSAGHASGFDLVIVDELGIFPDRSRELLAGLRSSTSARDGRIIAISIRGDSVLLQEIIDRRDQPTTAVHLYEAAADCALDDRAAWAAANPGLGTIKSLEYMADEAARVAVTPADQNSFRAFDLNAKLSPDRMPIVTVDQWKACIVDDLPARSGPCYLGLDLGGSSSMTTAVAYWPKTFRVEAWGAYPAVPDLLVRGRADAVGPNYQLMQDAGELLIFGTGEVTDVSGFIQHVAGELAGQRIRSVGCDRYRQAEGRTALAEAGIAWPIQWRGTGAHAKADGSHDVRAFQNAVMGRRVAVGQSLLWASALSGSMIRIDEAGNPALYKATDRGRIDVVQAAVIAFGLAAIDSAKPKRTWRGGGLA